MITTKFKVDISKEAIKRELNMVNEQLSSRKQLVASYKLITMNVEDIHPSQHGDDYYNPSSKYLGECFKKNEYTERKADYYPIVVDKQNVIVDGNHRHCAYGMAGIKKVPVLQIITKKLQEAKLNLKRIIEQFDIPSKKETAKVLENDPVVLYHGTKLENIKEISRVGLEKGMATTWKEYADDYGKLSPPSKSKGMLVIITIPQNKWRYYFKQGFQAHMFYIKNTIPPKYLSFSE